MTDQRIERAYYCPNRTAHGVCQAERAVVIHGGVADGVPVTVERCPVCGAPPIEDNLVFNPPLRVPGREE